MLTRRQITVGVTGGIAAYKAAELVRLLVKEEARVQVVMTPAAEKFISRLTLQTLSGRLVGSEIFDLDSESQIGHIRVADETELFVIAPATADVIARLAAGMANDLLSTIALATKAPLLIAPAMNVNMWDHPQTQENLAKLVSRGARVVGPGSGDLACGWVGSGRMAEPPAIVAAVHAALENLAAGESSEATILDLADRHVVVSAGPTHEPLDPVRYLANLSTGKMGFAVARRAAARGARVTLVAGPVSLPSPPGVERVDVQTARQMRDALVACDGEADVIVMAAAVADYRPMLIAREKIKKTNASTLTLTLEKNPDILLELATRRRDSASKDLPILVGFAAETGLIDKKAQEKLEAKGCDLLVGNDVSEAGSGFGTDTNRVTFYTPEQAPEKLPLLSKDDVADRLLDWVVEQLAGKNA